MGQHITREGIYDEFRTSKNKDGERLMPTTPTRAGMMIKCGDATPYWDNGIFCIRLSREPSRRYKQEIAVGVDPGSKKEGFSIKSDAHTYLNVQADAHRHTAKKLENRSQLRRGRRSRKCPIVRIEQTDLLTGCVFLLARVRDRIGNCGYCDGCRSSIL